MQLENARLNDCFMGGVFMDKNNKDKCGDCECYKCMLKRECFECYSCRNNANFTDETKTKCCDRKIDKWK